MMRIGGAVAVRGNVGAAAAAPLSVTGAGLIDPPTLTIALHDVHHPILVRNLRLLTSHHSK